MLRDAQWTAEEIAGALEYAAPYDHGMVCGCSSCYWTNVSWLAFVRGFRRARATKRDIPPEEKR